MANNHTPLPSDFPENGPDRDARRRRRHLKAGSTTSKRL